MQIDLQLLAYAKAGDPRAMSSLLAALRPDVQRYAAYHCGRASAVDEVVQETLLVVSRRLGQLNTLAAFAGWVVTIVTRICLWPALKLARGVEGLWQASAEDVLPARPSEALRLDIVRALESLPADQREVVIMRDFEGLTIGEMAERLQLTRAATKSRLHRARALIREYLTEGACRA